MEVCPKDGVVFRLGRSEKVFKRSQDTGNRPVGRESQNPTNLLILRILIKKGNSTSYIFSAIKKHYLCRKNKLLKNCFNEKDFVDIYCDRLYERLYCEAVKRDGNG
jgi:hypothetical protein